MLTRSSSALLLVLVGCGASSAPSPAAPSPTVATTAAPSASAKAPAASPEIGLDRIQHDAKKLEPLVTSPFAKTFLAATAKLPHIPARSIYHDADKSHFYSQCEEVELKPEAQKALTAVPVDEELYYNTKYGSPLSYARPIDLLASRGVSFAPKSKLLDFGYGYVGHLRLLASLGLDATGVDVDPMLRALYAEDEDQGKIDGQGTVRLLDGAFPKDPSVVAQVGKGYDVIISKNVLKKGYIHPDRPVSNPKALIQLGASDEAVLKAFYDALNPGGMFLVFNICPALTPPDKPLIPWSDGRSPWSKEQWEKAGFVVLEIDHDDLAAVNKMAHALGWGDDPDDKWDVDHDMSALYTLVQRPNAGGSQRGR